MSIEIKHERSLAEGIIPVASLILVVGLWYLSYYYITTKTFNDPNDSEIWARRGQMGDLFGAVNALFSGLAFAGIIYTILLQRTELKEQRQELKLSRLEVAEQNKTLQRQRFENTFFSLLNLHNDIIKTVNSNDHIGRKAFDYAFGQNIFGFGPQIKKSYEEHYFDIFRSEYDSGFMRSHYISFAHYVQSLNSVYKLVKESDLITNLERSLYYQILASTVSISEKRFLFYHLSFARGSEIVANLKEFHQKSGVLNDINADQFFNPSHLELIKRI